MIQTSIGVAKPRNKNILMPPSRRPKGIGRRNPHDSKYTKKQKPRNDNLALDISDGFDKISLFFTGRKRAKGVEPVDNSKNPFMNVINKLIKGLK